MLQQGQNDTIRIIFLAIYIIWTLLLDNNLLLLYSDARDWGRSENFLEAHNIQ